MKPESERPQIPCCCKSYQSIDAIQAILTDKDSDQVKDLIWWLSSACVNKQCCNRGRVSVSFLLLNAIRDTCHPYLENSSLKSETTASPTKPKAPEASSEDAFPPLFSAAGKKAKSKRRIRPAQIEPAVGKAKIQPIAWGSRTMGGNLVGLPHQEPLRVNSNSNGEGPVVTKTSPGKKKALTPTKKSSNAFVATPPMKQRIAPQPVESESETTPTSFDRGAIDRLAELHCCLIDHCLVPSSFLELHLLFRLLSLNKSVAPSTDPLPLRSVLPNAIAFIVFARSCIHRHTQRIIGIGPILWKGLIQWPTLRQNLPDLVKDMEARMAQEDLLAVPSLPSSQPTSVQLTLPFNQQRDSRHNFRSTFEQDLYRNRESSRDAFLYQLRAFLKVRGKVVDATQVARAVQTVKDSARQVVAGLMEANGWWFAEFLCDLLLQIGLVPLEETDQDLLRIADKAKLQKLHQRFSASASHHHKNNRQKGVLAAQPKHHSTSPKEEAQLMFPGHQEFFYLFILSADSYSFNHFLRSHLVERMMRIQDDTASSAASFEANLMKLRMLARFVGVLFMSPNWLAMNQQETQSFKIVPVGLSALDQLASTGLSVVDSLSNAGQGRDTALVVAWVVEILRMAVWDNHTRKSIMYDRVLAQLRVIHFDSCVMGESLEKRIIQQSLEFLFGEVVGLAKTADIHLTRQDSAPEETSIPISPVFRISDSSMKACLPHLGELLSLVQQLTRPDTASLKSPGVTRKLRPSLLLSVGTEETTNLPRNDTSGSHSGDVFRSELADSFFHQHPALKEICDFSVTKSLQFLSTREFEERVVSSFSGKMTGEFDETGVSALFCEYCRNTIRSELEVKISTTLVTFEPTTDAKVKNIAIDLAVCKGMSAADPLVQRMYKSNGQKWTPRGKNIPGKQLFHDGVEAGESVSTNRFRVCGTLLLRLANLLRQSQSIDLEAVTNEMEVLHTALCNIPFDIDIPKDDDIQPLFLGIVRLDRHLETLLDMLLDEDCQHLAKNQTAVELLVRIGHSINTWSVHGLTTLRSRLRVPAVMERLVREFSNSDETLQLLQRLVDS